MNPSPHPSNHPRRRRSADLRDGPRNARGDGARLGRAPHRHRASVPSATGDRPTISYPELGDVVTEIARGLIALGIEPGDRVAILGSDLGRMDAGRLRDLCAGAVVTPIYHTNSPAGMRVRARALGRALVFCEDAAQAAKIEQIRDRCPELEHIVLFDGESPTAR